MAIVLGVDLGTTTLTALALDTDSGNILASATRSNRAEVTSLVDQLSGRSEWHAAAIAETACGCLREVAEQIGGQDSLAGLGITGQQHGVVVVDEALRPLTPFINWQDRRGQETDGATGKSWVSATAERLGTDAPRRTGCRLASGYMAATLFWLKENGALPVTGRACFLMDYFTALLTGKSPVTDTTCAASGGVLNVPAGDWDADAIAALGLPRTLFLPIRPSGEPLGGLTAEAAARTGLPVGLPVCVGIGDNQASFLGSVAERDDTILVNVGTGGQVAAYTETFAHEPLLETRPFPRGGYLLVYAGLVGGRTYAALEGFFRQVGVQMLGQAPETRLYQAMNCVAAAVPRGSDGLRCEPFFTGTRAEPEVRASFQGISAENFTPAHLTRALLEGMARTFHDGCAPMLRHRREPCRQLVGAGNGLRENRVLAQAVADEFGMPLQVPGHREEAYGAALMAAVGTGVCADLDEAARRIRYGGGPG